MAPNVTFANSLDLASRRIAVRPHLLITTVYHTDVELVGFSAERDEAAAARAAASGEDEEDERGGGGSRDGGGGDDNGGDEKEDAAEQQQQEAGARRGDDEGEAEAEAEESGSSSSSSSSSSRTSSPQEEEEEEDGDAADADAADADAAAMAAMGLPVAFGGGGRGGGGADLGEDDDGGGWTAENAKAAKSKKKKNSNNNKRCWRPPMHARQARSAAEVTAAAAAAVAAAGGGGGQPAPPGAVHEVSLRLRAELAEEPRAQALLRRLGLWAAADGEEEEEGGGKARRPQHHHQHHGRRHVKYWLQRYSLFSRYDAGVRLDVEGWYSVTPECVALWQARRALGIVFASGWQGGGGQGGGEGLVVLDAFAGCGGNTIALRRALDDPDLGTSPSASSLQEVRRGGGGAADAPPPPPPPLPPPPLPGAAAGDGGGSGGRVVAVEIDRARLAMARHNARVYGYPPSSIDSIEWIHGDFFAACADAAADVVFFSPPWGGPAYRADGAVFGRPDDPLPGIGIALADLLEFGRKIVRRRLLAAAAAAKRGRRERDRRGAVVCFLPRNTSVAAIGCLAKAAGTGDGEDLWGGVVWQVERNVLNGHLKGVTLYCPVSG